PRHKQTLKYHTIDSSVTVKRHTPNYPLLVLSGQYGRRRQRSEQQKGYDTQLTWFTNLGYVATLAPYCQPFRHRQERAVPLYSRRLSCFRRRQRGSGAHLLRDVRSALARSGTLHRRADGRNGDAAVRRADAVRSRRQAAAWTV